MAESGNANSKSSPEIISKDSTDTFSKCNGSGSDSRNGVKLDQKFQITDGPVIRMGTGVLISRREIRNHPNSLPVKPPHSVNMATWKDVSPPKDRKNLVDISPQNQNKEENVDEGTYEPKNRSPIRTNPFHEIGTVYRGVDGNFQSIKRIKTDLITNPMERKNSFPGVVQQNTTLPPELASAFPQMAILTTWRDMSPTKSQSEGKKKRPESGYFSNDVQSEGGQESREGIDTSLSDSECSRKDRSSLPSEEGCFNSDYFYEDEFSVPFDTNLHQPTRQVEQGASGEQIILPHSLNGSYTKFGGLRDSLLQAEMYLGPYESEMSGSRTSMEISSSEREMMCSSDMLNFSNDPLFTPSPPPTEQTQQQQQNVSVDSLSHQGHTGDMSNSRSSADANLTVDCCIRKDAYFLSFNGSQEQRSTTESDISYASQTSSHDECQGGTQSDNSNAGDAEDECSNSFQFQDDKEKQQPTPVAAPPPIQYHPVRNMLLSRYPGRICLEALQEYLLDRSNSTKSPGSSRHSCSSHCKLSPLCGTLLSSGDLYASSGARRPGLRRSSNLTTWKQVKNLRKLGKEPNLHERSHSLPDLTSEDVKVVRRERPNRTLESMAESFHKKRHSDYVLEVYQQMLAGSNPPSPTTLSKIDQILFQEQFVQAETTHKQEPVKEDCMSCPSCGTQKQKSLYLDLRRDAQCGQSRYTAQTDISPQTLMLWHGQKNFSSQFPPNTLDCGIQTSIDEQDGPPVNSRSMQTSPSSPGTDLFHMLNELRIKEEHKSRSHEKERPVQASLPRAKSATECRDSHAERLKMQMRRTVSLSPSRIGINSFYSHQSLPDLSFLSVSNRHLSKSRESSSSGISLFDPVQIPIILTPVLDDGCRSSQSRSSGSSHCGCAREPSQPPRRRRCGSLGRSSDPHSSGSNCSLSSSSGIDPNYVEPRSYTGLAPELEHLLFLPPHLESAYVQLGLAEAVSKCETLSEREEEEACEAQECSREGLCHGSPVKQSSRLDRYANEAYPSSSQGKTVVKTGKTTQRPAKCSSSGLLVHERLDALKEEKTPSPEPSYCHYPLRDYTDHRCFGCEECSEADSSSQELDEEKLQMYQQWLKDRKPPLKSCLRKRCDRDQKARSLSLDVEPDNPPEKPPRRPNRHSIACDGMFPVLVTEEGFECAIVDPPPRCPPHHVEQVLPEVSQEKVVMRRKKPNPVLSESAEGSSQDEMNRAKRVSFASEVSFHSPNYTPQSSPRRQSGQAEVTAMELEENDILTLHVVRKERGNNTKTSDPGKETSHTLQLSNEMPPQEFSVASSESSESVLPELSPIDLKSNVLRGVIEASEALVRHFAQARDPFDKVRLGSFQETPAIGALVVTMLCPAIEQVVHDGLKSFLTGFHIFGKIHISTWRVAESSAEIGPYTRAINDLVKQLKVRPNVISHKQKFYAFLTGLLNLRLLDFWMGYISTKESIVGRFYEQNSILCLSQSVLDRKYQDMLLALQPLSVLPFQIDYDIVSNYSLADSTLMGESDVISSSSAKVKVDLSSSPKVVVARVKNRMSASPDRSSWAGYTDHQDVYANVDKVGQDFSSRGIGLKLQPSQRPNPSCLI
ncbi:uncharacterized protein LOC112556346 isoform X2 [Pomacea canaliculata]|nr:uncharacterized protein LOC112556346 isoform X2 [Pomacea canaliculata]